MRRTIAAVAAVAALGAVAAQPAAAAPTCTLNNGRTYPQFVQSNGWTVNLPIQVGNQISGMAGAFPPDWDYEDNPSIRGEAEGVVTGRRVRVTVLWENG